MKILAIEASGLAASVAVADDDILKAEFTINNKLTHSQTLLPMIKTMLEISEESIGGMDAVAISAGPGSFTGLRIGAATGKGLALAADIPVVKVSALEALMLNISADRTDIICPIMDARRGQVYCGAWRNGEKVVEEKACALEELIAELEALSGSVIFTGDGVPAYKETIKLLMEGAFFADSANNRQRAASVAALGLSKYRAWLLKNDLCAEEVKKAGADRISCFDGTVMNSDEFSPEYLRKPQAEREKDAGLLEDAGSRSLKKIARGGK